MSAVLRGSSSLYHILYKRSVSARTLLMRLEHLYCFLY